jgi:5,5'-dehydrodivanillate O-demethylase
LVSLAAAVAMRDDAAAVDLAFRKGQAPMNVKPEIHPLADKLMLLSQTSGDTPIGRLMRRFWQPVARSETLKPGKAQPLRILSEDLTLYRGQSGEPHLVGGRCPHRRTLLHTGWVQGDNIRCMYHGWQFNGLGQCIQRPAEGDIRPPRETIACYPLREYCGLIFAYMGEGAPPEFQLPRKDVFERPDGLLFTRSETWPCNWFQQIENSLDATHVSFVHHWGEVGTFGEAVAATIPQLEYLETEAGIRQIATRSKTSRRVTDWTFPNNNHISQPGLRHDDPWIDVGIWMTPVDDTHTTRFILYSIASSTPDADARITRYFEEFGDYDPTDFHDELFIHQRMPKDTLMQLTSAQDYVAAVGQGAIADRTTERLGKSDMGIAFLRRIFFREMAALLDSRPMKPWHKLEHAAEMPHQIREPAQA